MSTFLCFIQIVSGPSCNYIFLVGKIVFQHFRKRKNLWFQTAIGGNQTKHDHTKSILKLCMLVQLIQDYISIGIFAEINTDTHTLSAGMVIQIRDSVNFFISYQFGNFLYKTCFVYQIWKFCNNNAGLAIRKSLNICYSTYADLSTSGTISFFDSSGSQNSSSCREIRTFYDLKNFFNGGFSLFLNDIVNNFDNSTDHLSQVMGWNIGSHTYCNTGSTIYQKIRVTGWQYYRFSFCFVKVWLKIYSIFIDICKHFHGDFAETGLCISHGSCTISIY